LTFLPQLHSRTGSLTLHNRKLEDFAQMPFRQLRRFAEQRRETQLDRGERQGMVKGFATREKAQADRIRQRVEMYAKLRDLPAGDLYAHY